MSIKKKVSTKGLFNYGQDIVMAFLPTVVGCLVKKKAYKRGVTGTPGPPLAMPLLMAINSLQHVVQHFVQIQQHPLDDMVLVLFYWDPHGA